MILFQGPYSKDPSTCNTCETCTNHIPVVAANKIFLFIDTSRDVLKISDTSNTCIASNYSALAFWQQFYNSTSYYYLQASKSETVKESQKIGRNKVIQTVMTDYY